MEITEEETSSKFQSERKAKQAGGEEVNGDDSGDLYVVQSPFLFQFNLTTVVVHGTWYDLVSP